MTVEIETGARRIISHRRPRWARYKAAGAAGAINSGLRSPAPRPRQPEESVRRIMAATRAEVAGQIVRSTRCRDVHEHVAALLSRDVRGFKTTWAFQQPCIYLHSRTAAAGARTPALRSRPSIGGTAA